MKRNMVVIMATLVLLALAGCSNKEEVIEDTDTIVEEPAEEVQTEDDSKEEYSYTSDAYEYQQLESLLQKLKEETQ